MVRNGDTLEPQPSPTDTDGKPRDVFALFHDFHVRMLFEPLVEAVVQRQQLRTPTAFYAFGK